MTSIESTSTNFDSELNEIFSDESDDSLHSLCEDLLNKLKPYMYEPEYSSEECESSESELEDETHKNKAQEKVENRVGNTNWCICKHCKRETRNIDCLCCREELRISDDKFEGKYIFLNFFEHFTSKFDIYYYVINFHLFRKRVHN